MGSPATKASLMERLRVAIVLWAHTPRNLNSIHVAVKRVLWETHMESTLRKRSYKVKGPILIENATNFEPGVTGKQSSLLSTTCF